MRQEKSQWLYCIGNTHCYVMNCFAQFDDDDDDADGPGDDEDDDDNELLWPLFTLPCPALSESLTVIKTSFNRLHDIRTAFS